MLLSSVTIQPQISQAQGQLCHCLPALGLSLALVVQKPHPELPIQPPQKRGGILPLSAPCAKRGYTELLQHFCFSDSVRSWLFSRGEPFPGLWQAEEPQGRRTAHPQQPRQVLSLCRRLCQMPAGLSPTAGLAGVTHTSVLLLS